MSDIAPDPEAGTNIETYTRITSSTFRSGVGYRIRLDYTNPDFPDWRKTEVSQQMFPTEQAAQSTGYSVVQAIQARLESHAN